MVAREKAFKQRKNTDHTKNGNDDDDNDNNNNIEKSSNIETQFQNQIQNQLQNQLQNELQNELNKTFQEHRDSNSNIENDDGDAVVDVVNVDVSDVDVEHANNDHPNNILDSTNIDDELRNLEPLDINNIAKSAVSFAQAATATGISADDDGNVNIDSDLNSIDEHSNSINKTEPVKIDDRIQLSNNTDISTLLKGSDFWLSTPSPKNDELKTLIKSMGGNVVDEFNNDVIPLVPIKTQISAAYPLQYLYAYIFDTYSKRTVLDINKYRVGRITAQPLKINIGEFPIKHLPDDNLASGSTDTSNTKSTLETDSKSAASKKKKSKPVDPLKPKKTSNKFTKEEDDFILDLVRRNPHLRSTHTFFARIAQLKPLSSHTGNSIRYRYRKVLAPSLTYVYKIDDKTGEPVIDPETNFPMKVEEIPSLIKSQYTAEEDYELCKHIISYKNGELVIPGKKKLEVSQIPEVVFQELHKINPRHSAMSWRDRYRKFAAKFGLKRYVIYYDKCKQRNQIPNPMKNMSSRSDRKDYKVDTFGEDLDVERPAKRLKTDDYKIDGQNSDNVSEQKTEIPNGNNFDEATSTAKGALEALANASAEQKSLVDEIETNDSKNTKESDKDGADKETKESKESIATDKDVHDDVVTDTIKNITENVDKDITQSVEAISNVDSGANLFVDATEDEMKEYDIALHNSQLEDDSNPTVDKKDNNDVELVDVKADDGLMDFRQLIDIDPEPLKNRDNIDTDRMISNIRICFRNFADSSTPYELYKDISDQTGISMLWLNYWYDCSCGMLGTFIQAIINYLKTGELIMNSVPGFWTEKDDELLRVDPDNKDLLKLHGEESVTKRKAVLFRYV